MTASASTPPIIDSLAATAYEGGMKPSERPYHWFAVLIDAAKAAFEFIAIQHALPSPEIKSWTLDGDTYGPVTTLTWKTNDEVSRNLHLTVVAPDDASFLVPGSKAVVDANAWIDIVGSGGRVARRAMSYEIGRLENLTQEAADQRVADLQILLWQAYGAISRVDRAALLSERAERLARQDADPGPIRLEVWLGE